MFELGYYMESTNFTNVEMMLQEMRKVIMREADKRYHKQLSSEIEYLIDRITVGEFQRPENMTLYDAAVSLLQVRMEKAERVLADSSYDYKVSVNVLVLEGKVYFKINTSVSDYEKKLNKIQGLQPFQMGEKWAPLIEKYKNEPIMWMQLLSGADMKPDRKKLKFASKIERADRLARHKCTNHLLSQYSCGENIEPYQMMEFIDLAMNDLLTNRFYKEEHNKNKVNAVAFLLDITDDILFGEKTSNCDEKENSTENLSEDGTAGFEGKPECEENPITVN